MNWQTEAFASLLLLLNVWLVARRSLWNYAFGIAAVSFYIFVFWGAKLYAAVGLQFLFLGLNLFGLWNWKQARAQVGDIAISGMSRAERMATLATICMLSAGIGLLLNHTTDAVSPYWDSANTAIALSAQFWQARRRLESWILWILVNIGSVGLYASQGLIFTGTVYAILLLVAIYGLHSWKQAENKVA